eukprot:CAMPEP_0170410238 /NCGR_PEP_ID=MMETSP0117_2-20130122/29772_1 /TAXON_ID=400756 /ORGANISM="Durinskia baltica, Strain CSIRO CS-38" /LENGTH=49 /DNA_ID= /DNA_START= /DNA_END= /DNA_ORIENTATION=
MTLHVCPSRHRGVGLWLYCARWAARAARLAQAIRKRRGTAMPPGDMRSQ